MDKRSFLKTAPVSLLGGVGIAATIAPGKTGAASFVEQPIVTRIHLPINCDLTGMSVEDGLSRIIKAAGTVPRAYRITCSAFKYPYAKQVCEWLKAKGDLHVEVRCDINQADSEAWYLEGNGVLLYSPGG